MENEKSSLRNFQDRIANQGWRIRLIPFDDSSKPMAAQTNWYAMIGAIVFLGGCGLYFRDRDIRYIYFAVAGLAFAFVGLWLVARNKRRGWIKVEAECVDKEIQKTLGQKNYTWAFRILCRFDFAGKNYSVTPVFWRTFSSEKAIEDFLASKIRGDGRCFLYINPKNPLRTELAADDIADKLLH